MNISNVTHKWATFVNRMNRFGIPVPTIRDPKTGRGSITTTLVVFSAGLFGFCIFFMLASAVAKWGGFFILTEASLAQIKTAADYSFQFLLAALGGYLGRKLQKDEVNPSQEKNNAPARQPVDNPD